MRNASLDPGKSKEMKRLPEPPPQGVRPCQLLDISTAVLILDLGPPEL